MNQKLSPGSMLGPYKIIRLIDKGGMGEVYEAFEEVLQRSVALKIITDQAVTGIPEVLRLFISEGKALAQLNHPNVVTIYQLGHDKGIYYIAMEYIEGISLDVFIQKNPPDLKRDLYIFYKILLGVKALHRKGIIHRDLKPKNVIIHGDKVVKIVDFGIAEILREPRSEDQQHSNVLMGSVYYMSPEVSKGGPATFQSDIWSLGVLFYQLMTRQRPFTGKTQTEILSKVREAPITFPTVTGIAVPTKYKDIALKMCHRTLSERYQSIDEIIVDLGNVSKNPSHSSRTAEMLLIGLAAIITTVLVTWHFTKGNRSHPMPSESSIVSMIPVTSTTQAPTSLAPPEPPAVAVVESPSTTTTLGPAAKIVSTLPKEIISLAAPKLKFYQNQVVLKFKAGAGARNPASAQKAILNLPTLAWNQIKNSKSFLIQIASDTAFTKPLISKEVSGNSYKFEKAQPGIFYWRVQALSQSGTRSDFSDIGTLQIQVPTPTAEKSAYKFVVKASEKLSQKNTIRWNAIPLISLFQVTISKRGVIDSPVIEETVRGNQLSFGNLPNGNYDFQIVALDSKRQPASQPSVIASIQIQQASKLPQPILQQPSNGTNVPSQGTMITPIACSWDEIKQVTTYEYQLASDSAFKKIMHQTSTPKNQYVLVLPLSKGKFYWRVRAISKEEDPSPWSEIRNFTID